MILLCYECDNLLPIYEAYYESEIKDSLETADNPFEANESEFLSNERRDKHKKGVTRHTSMRFITDDDEDPDIQREIYRHGSDNVRIIQ